MNFHFRFVSVDSRPAELLESFDCDHIASPFSWLSPWYTEDVPFKDDFLVYHKHIFEKAQTPDSKVLWSSQSYSVNPHASSQGKIEKMVLGVVLTDSTLVKWEVSIAKKG